MFQGSQNGAGSDSGETSSYVPGAWYLSYGKHMGPCRECSETGCFIEPVPRVSPEGSRRPLVRFFDGFRTPVGIHFASMEPSIFGAFFGCVSETAHDKLTCMVAGPAGPGWGGIPYPGHPSSGLVKIQITNAKRQSFGLARQISSSAQVLYPPPCLHLYVHEVLLLRGGCC